MTGQNEVSQFAKRVVQSRQNLQVRRRSRRLAPGVIALCLVMVLAPSVAMVHASRAAPSAVRLTPDHITPEYSCLLGQIDFYMSPVNGYAGSEYNMYVSATNVGISILYIFYFDFGLTWDSSAWAPSYPDLDFNPGGYTYLTDTDGPPLGASGEYAGNFVVDFEYGGYGGTIYECTGTIDFAVAAHPSVSVAASPTSGTAPLAVTFTATTYGGFSGGSVSWNFGDGTTGGDVLSTSHTYATAGTYRASITWTDGLGTVVSGDSPSISVGSVSTLTASADASPTSGQAPLPVSFTGSASGGSGTYTYSWNFGDGTATSTLQDPTHTYATAGTYLATLTVTDSVSHQQATHTVSITVTSAGGGGGSGTGSSGSPSSPSALTWGIIATVVVVAAIVAGILLLRRGRTPVTTGGPPSGVSPPSPPGTPMAPP
jgi:PKD repeat protein